jgi:hypothetical protein
MLVVQQLVQRLRGDRARIVRFPLRLLDDHLELLRQLVGVDDRVRVRVELHVERRREPRRWDDGVVARVIVDRGRVEVAAHRLRLTRDLAHAARRRALEEHVLEHVCDAHDVVGLVEVAGADVGDDGHHGRRPVLPQHHDESVREHGAADRRRIESGREVGGRHE